MLWTITNTSTETESYWVGGGVVIKYKHKELSETIVPFYLTNI